MRQLTKEEAIALAKTQWWVDMEPVAVAHFQLSQRLLCMDFSAFHGAIESALGRPVYIHEFIDRQALLDELNGIKSPPTLEDIIAMIPAEKRIIVL